MKTRYFIVFLLFSVCTQARVLHVDMGKGPITTLGLALSMAVAGDTILVAPGEYCEVNLEVRVPVVIMGRGLPVIDGEGKGEIMTIMSDRVVVEGLLFRNSGRSSYNDVAALRVMDCRNVLIRNNQFEKNFFAVYTQHVTSCRIEGNQIQSDAQDEINSANGIHCWKSDSLVIVSNKITGHRDGIYFEFVTHSLVENNYSYRNIRYGIHFMFSNNDVYRLNRFSDNGAGVAVMYSSRIHMLNNIFSDNWGSAAYGILLKDISDGSIEGNRFLRNSVGILMEGSSRLQLRKNLFRNNGWALKIQANCADNVITANNFLSNSFDVATNGDLVLSRFERNYWDKYEGYDLNRNGVGDVPYRPLSLFAMISERNASVIMLYRSFMATLLDRIEKILPALTPADMKDDHPLMRPVQL
ncbi:MAG: nitrous oxide reductase family maturation protein NosD [Lacibacter sp.]|jgi:nitrous oxidase accessory protein